MIVSKTLLLYFAAFLAFGLGAAHSYLGERFILVRLFRRGQLPPLFGGTHFTQRTLRFAWHITAVLWWGFAGLFLLLAQNRCTPRNVALITAATFLVSGILAAGGSRGKHLAWIVLVAIGLLALCAIT